MHEIQEFSDQVLVQERVAERSNCRGGLLIKSKFPQYRRAALPCAFRDLPRLTVHFETVAYANAFPVCSPCLRSTSRASEF